VIPGYCWRCEEPGHAAAECQRPPAATKKELHARIERHVDRWMAGSIDTIQKRQFIAAENRAYEKEKAK
jgi:hypothetical protein